MLQVHAGWIHLIPRRHSRLPRLYQDPLPLVFSATSSTLPWNLRSQNSSFRSHIDRRIPEEILPGKGYGRRQLPWTRGSSSCKHPSHRRRVLVKEKSTAASKIPSATTVRIAEVNEEEATAGFQISATELASIVEDQDLGKLSNLGGVEGIAEKISSSLVRGISSADDQIRARRDIYGVNELTEPEQKSFWAFLLDAAQDSTLIILGACAVISLLVGVSVEGWPAGSHDGLGIAASITLVVLVTASSNYRQSLQFRDLDAEKKKISIQVTRSGSRKKLPVSDLLPGDIVHLSIGDQVPADGLFVSGFSLLVNASSLTGESEPVAVNAENLFLSSGTKIQDGFGKMLVTSVGMRTQWGKLVAALGETEEGETPLQVKLNGVASVIGKIGLFFAVLTFLVLAGGLVNEKVYDGSLMNWTGDDALEILNYFAIAVTIVVVAVPEGLPLAVTLSLAFAMKQMMNDRALVRHLAACETMGSATCICSDKTGTLTTNRMTVVKALICGRIFDLSDEAGLTQAKTLIPAPAMKVLLQAVFCNTSGEVVFDEKGGFEILGSPTESSLLALGMSLGKGVVEKVNLVKVEPFNSSKKRMSVLVEVQDGGQVAYCKGASEMVFSSCDRVIDPIGDSVPLDESTRSEINRTIERFSGEALRTICLAYKDVDSGFRVDDQIPQEGYTCIGIVGIKDPVRPGVKESVALCRSAGIAVRMITGDNINTARAIALECGILSEGGIVIEGPDFRRKSEEELLELVPKIQVMARSSPLDKLALVKHLRTQCNEVVAVTGDGTNDAPALREADIGLSMGISGTEVAKESSDVIILDDNFSTIVTVAKWGRSVYVNIQKFVQFQLTVNAVALIVNFSSACITGHAPLTAVQLLWVNMIMDSLGALALATEPPKDELMKRSPVGRNNSFIDDLMWRNIAGQTIYQLFLIWALNAEGKAIFHLSGPTADPILNTIIFNSFIFCQIFNEISSRDMEKIDVITGLSDNYVFLGVIVCTVVFQVVIVQFLGEFASTVPLDLEQWIFCVSVGFLGMPVAAAAKLIPPPKLRP